MVFAVGSVRWLAKQNYHGNIGKRRVSVTLLLGKYYYVQDILLRIPQNMTCGLYADEQSQVMCGAFELVQWDLIDEAMSKDIKTTTMLHVTNNFYLLL